MTGVRLLVGTQKGAFVVSADGQRRDWEVSGPHFGGWEVYHLVGAPNDPMRAVCVTVDGMVRSDHPALRRRWPFLAGRRERVRLRGKRRHPPVVRRDAAPVGVRAGLAPRTIRHRP